MLRALLRLGATGHRTALTAVASVAATGVRSLASFVTIPFLLDGLGEEGLGVWLVALSALGLSGFLNSGLGGAVINAIGRAVDDSGNRQIERWTTAATLLGLLSGVVTLLVGLVLVTFVPWERIFGIPESVGEGQIRMLMLAVVVCLATGFPSQVPKFVMIGRLRGYVVFTADAVGLVVATSGLLTLLHYEAPLWALFLVFIVPQNFASCLAGAIALWTDGIRLWRPSEVAAKEITQLVLDLVRFATHQLTHSLATHTDQLLISSIAGFSASAAYGIAQRLFSIPIQLTAIVNQALWPELGRADAKGRFSWVMSTFTRTIVTLGSVSLAFTVGLVFFYDEILLLWLDSPPTEDQLLVVGMAFWVGVTVLANTSDTLLRALNATTLLVRSMTLMMTINLVVSIYLVPVIGAAGAVWGTVIAYTLCLLLPYSIAIVRYARGARFDPQQQPESPV